MDHVGPQPSRVASEDELGAHATAGWHQSVEVKWRRFLVATVEVSTCVIHCYTSLLSVEG